MKPSITEAQIINALGDFITLVTGIPAVKGQVNRVPTLKGDYAVMWPLTRPRLSTNRKTPIDCKFIAAIIGPLMTVSAVPIGTIVLGRQLIAPGISANTIILEQQSGETGGAGVYLVSIEQVVASQVMSAGVMSIEESNEVIMQVDVHGPCSSDNTQSLQQLFWDAYAVDVLSPTGVTPLFAEDPRQMPFITAAKEYEDRWTIDLHMQIKPVIEIPLEFSDSFTLTVVDVEVSIPSTGSLDTDLSNPDNEVIVPAILTGV
jgi:hypothetical protein